jgi:hypothetical protein
MAMTVATFIVKYPEFALQPTAYLQTFIDDATLAVSSDTFGVLTDQATGLLAAHRLCQTPWGQAAKLVAVLKSMDPMGNTVYGVAYMELLSSVSLGATTC